MDHMSIGAGFFIKIQDEMVHDDYTKMKIKKAK
jgi:hypothetical protein